MADNLNDPIAGGEEAWRIVREGEQNDLGVVRVPQTASSASPSVAPPPPSAPAPQPVEDPVDAGKNPYDQFDDSGFVASQRDPTIGERFEANRRAGYRSTLSGAGRAAYLADRAFDPSKPLDVADWLEYKKMKEDEELYNMMSWSSNPLELGAAIAGQLVGAMGSPESFVGATVAGGRTITSRILSAAVYEAGINAGIDVPVQALRIKSGLQEKYEPIDTLVSAGLGGTLGAVSRSGVELLSGEVGRFLVERATRDVNVKAPDPSENINIATIEEIEGRTSTTPTDGAEADAGATVPGEGPQPADTPSVGQDEATAAQPLRLADNLVEYVEPTPEMQARINSSPFTPMEAAKLTQDSLNFLESTYSTAAARNAADFDSKVLDIRLIKKQFNDALVKLGGDFATVGHDDPRFQASVQALVDATEGKIKIIQGEHRNILGSDVTDTGYKPVDKLDAEISAYENKLKVFRDEYNSQLANAKKDLGVGVINRNEYETIRDNIDLVYGAKEQELHRAFENGSFRYEVFGVEKPATNDIPGFNFHNWVWDSGPSPEELTKSSVSANLGGAGKKDVYVNKYGDEYIYKYATTKAGEPAPYKVYSQLAAAQTASFVSDMNGQKMPFASIVGDGDKGTLQYRIPNSYPVNTFSWATKKGAHSVTQLSMFKILKNHIVDWGIGDYDGHPGNIVYDALTDRFIGVDKEQSFRYIEDPKSHEFDYEYHPNAQYGEQEPLAHTFWREISNGNLKLSNDQIIDLLFTAKQFSLIPDDLYRETWKPYAEAVHAGHPERAEYLLDAIVDRKNNLYDRYVDFVTENTDNSMLNANLEYMKLYNNFTNSYVSMTEFSAGVDKIVTKYGVDEYKLSSTDNTIKSYNTLFDANQKFLMSRDDALTPQQYDVLFKATDIKMMEQSFKYFKDQLIADSVSSDVLPSNLLKDVFDKEIITDFSDVSTSVPKKLSNDEEIAKDMGKVKNLFKGSKNPNPSTQSPRSYSFDALPVYGEATSLRDTIKYRPWVLSTGETWKGYPIALREAFDTPEFKAWFDGSTIVDQYGRPLIVWHASFTEFDKFKMGHYTGFYFSSTVDGAAKFKGLGISSFAKTKKELGKIGPYHKPNVKVGNGVMYPVVIRMTNPASTNMPTARTVWSFILKDEFKNDPVISDGEFWVSLVGEDGVMGHGDIEKYVDPKWITGNNLRNFFAAVSNPDKNGINTIGHWSIGNSIGDLLRKAGFDGYIESESTHYPAHFAVFDAQNVKSVFNHGTWDINRQEMMHLDDSISSQKWNGISASVSDSEWNPAPHTIYDEHTGELILYNDGPKSASGKSTYDGEITRPSDGKISELSAKERQEVKVEEAAQKVGEALGLVVRQGRLQKPGTWGQYSTITGVVRLANLRDFSTLTHEAGHALHMHPSRKVDFDNLINSFPLEMAGLAYSMKPDLSDDLVGVEGFAEFMRRYIQKPSHAEASAPGFYKEFERLMAEKYPEILYPLKEATQAITKYNEAESIDVVVADIVSSTRSQFDGLRKAVVPQKSASGQTLFSLLDRMYTWVVDSNHPINKSISVMLKMHENLTGERVDIKAAQNPYVLARLAQNSAQGGHMDIIYGVHGYKNPVLTSRSLVEGIELAVGKNWSGSWDQDDLKLFGAYLAARRQIGEFDRPDVANPPGMHTKGDYITTVKQLEAEFPQFKDAAVIVHEWANAMLKKELDAGLITKDYYNKSLKIKDYVPLMRDFSERLDHMISSAGSINGRQSIMKAYRGSLRAVINPLESLVNRAYNTNITISKNEIVKSLNRIARSVGQESGIVAEQIPSNQLEGIRVNIADMLRQTGKALDIDESDIGDLIIQAHSILGEDNLMSTLYRSIPANERGEPIVYYFEGGVVKAVRLADGNLGKELFEAITGIGREQSNWVVEFLATPARWLRAGITTSPDFLAANFLRDQLSAFILNPHFIPFATGMRGVFSELGQDEAAKLYSMYGGIMGGAITASYDQSRITRSINKLQKQGYTVQRLKDPREFFKLTEISETGARLGLFKQYYDTGRKQGLTEHEALVEAAFQARDYMDFGRHGSRMLALRKTIAFLNAALQGTDKTARVLFNDAKPLAKLWSGQTLTRVERNKLSNSMLAWAKLGTLTAASMTYAALMQDNEVVQNTDEYIRSTHWVVPGSDGKIYLIPKPYELATFFNFGERVVDKFLSNDPTWMDRWVRSLAHTLALPNKPAGLMTPLEAYVFNHDTFTGRDLVPEYMQNYEARHQFLPYTSWFSKTVGAKLNVSPIKLDHMITGWAGSWGRHLLSATDQILDPKKRSSELYDAPITKRFVKLVSRGSDAGDQFWGQVSQATGELQRARLEWQNEIKVGRGEAVAQEVFNSFTDAQKVWTAVNEMDISIKRMHPLHRATNMMEVYRGISRELSVGNLTSTVTNDRIGVTPRVVAEIQANISKIQMIEARNGLIATGTEGWAQREPMDPTPYIEAIKILSPSVYSEIQDRIKKKKIYSYEGVRSVWPELKRRVLQDGFDAILGDLLTEAR